MKVFLLCSFICIPILGCSVLGEASHDGLQGSYFPSPRTNFVGVVYVSSGGGLKIAKPSMASECNKHGGLIETSIVELSNPGVIINIGGLSRFKYQCHPPKSPINNTPNNEVMRQNFQTNSPPSFEGRVQMIESPNVKSPMTLIEAKEKCGDLGFESGTERFGKCVLQLSK